VIVMMGLLVQKPQFWYLFSQRVTNVTEREVSDSQFSAGNPNAVTDAIIDWSTCTGSTTVKDPLSGNDVTVEWFNTALQACISPAPRNWRRRPGCPRHTWLRTVEEDLRQFNLGLASGLRRAQNRTAWRALTGTATSPTSSD